MASSTQLKLRASFAYGLQNYSLAVIQASQKDLGWLGVAKVLCILRHWGIQLMWQGLLSL